MLHAISHDNNNIGKNSEKMVQKNDIIIYYFMEVRWNNQPLPNVSAK